MATRIVNTQPITGLHLGEGCSPPAMVVTLTREPFTSWFTLMTADGSTEDLEPEEVTEWFRIRGARMDVVEKALDHAWNFYFVEVAIHSPKTPPRVVSSVMPKV